MKFFRAKKPDDEKQDSAETLQIKDAANILKEGNQIPGKENIPVSDKAADEDTEDYDFLNQLFEQQNSAAALQKKAEKRTTVTDLLKGKQKKTAEDKQPPKNKALRLCLILGIILAVLFASGVLFYTFTQAADDSSEIIDQIKLTFDPEKEMAKTENPAAALTPIPTSTPTPEKKDGLASSLTGLTIPKGEYFNAGKQTSDNAGGIYASEQNWQTIHTEGVSPGKWVVQDFRLTVNPAKVPAYYKNKQYSTVVIQEPWRISWKVSKTGTDPYTSAELILNQYDTEGNVIQTYGFGWKGKYSANTKQITPEFQPGEYALALFLRGTGITLDFQQNKAMPVLDNFNVREK